MGKNETSIVPTSLVCWVTDPALGRSHTFPANSNLKPALVQSLVLELTWFPSGLIQLVRVQSGKAQDVDPVPLQC